MLKLNGAQDHVVHSDNNLTYPPDKDSNGPLVHVIHAPAATSHKATSESLGDCGLRSAELRGLRARDLRRPRSNARHYRLYVHGKGGREREVPVPEATLAALDAWTAVHPLARGGGLRDEEPLFVRIGRHGTEPPLPLSSVAVHRIVRHDCQEAGVPDRLAHPHALGAYWATRCLELGVPVHEFSARLGHADLRTTARYTAARPERSEEIAEVLDRCHQAARRAGLGT